MEFYSIGGGSRLIGRLFQFPTGWNSTNIPDLHKLATLRFNSQLDGILLCLPICGGLILFAFQFPTGWNSTFVNFYAFIYSPASFNSQRDGILRIIDPQQERENSVSIPNGMEFYSVSGVF